VVAKTCQESWVWLVGSKLQCGKSVSVGGGGGLGQEVTACVILLQGGVRSIYYRNAIGEEQGRFKGQRAEFPVV